MALPEVIAAKVPGLALRLLMRVAPLVRRTRTRLIRGPLCFNLPKGKFFVLVPASAAEGPGEIAPFDQLAVDALRKMFAVLGYREGKDWELKRVRPGQDVEDSVRRQNNIIALGGPEANEFSRNVLGESCFSPIEYIPAGGGGQPEFRWRNHVFRPSRTHDFALLAIRANPWNPGRRVVLLFGARDVGTLGAALLYAEGDSYRQERARVRGAFSNPSSEAELLLLVRDGAAGDEPAEVRVARETDGAPLPRPAAIRPSDMAQAAVADGLRKISDSIEQYPRWFKISGLHFELVITADYGFGFTETATIAAAEKDIVVYAVKYSGTEPLARIEDLRLVGTVEESGSLAVIPAEDRPTYKSFLVFPLPPLVAGEPGRRIRMEAHWPRGAVSLQKSGSDVEEVQVSRKAIEPVQDVEVVIRFETPGVSYDVVEQFAAEGAARASTPAEGFGVNRPYSITIPVAPPGQSYAFRVVRRAGTTSA